MVKSQIIFWIDKTHKMLCTTSLLHEHVLSPWPCKHFTSAHQDKELNAMLLKKNVKTRPVYGNGDYPRLLWGFFAHFDYFLQISSWCEWRNYRQNHFGICGIFCKYFRARALRMSTGQSGHSALFCSIVDSTTLCTALYQSQCEAAGLNNSLAMCPGLPKWLLYTSNCAAVL